jgi:hypothetical protein
MSYFSLTMRDAYGRETSKRLEVEPQVDLATYATVAQDVNDKLADVTDLGIVRFDLVLENIITPSSAISPGANVDVGATFSGELSLDGNKKAAHKLPGFITLYVGADGSIDITQAEVAAWLDLFATIGGVLLLSDGEQIESWLSGRLDR